MRALFLILCLLNLGFFFWEFHKGALNPPIPPQIILPTIMLADELDNARRGMAISAYLDRDLAKLQQSQLVPPAEKPVAMPRPPKSEAPAVTKPTVAACYEVGPFADQQAVTVWLNGRALRGELFYKEVLTPSAYLVYYPAAKTSEQVRIQKMMLNAKGINDIWIIPSGELKGALSLGVFNDSSRAAAFKNQLLLRGVQAEVKERYKTQSRLFVRIKGEQKIPQHLAEGIAVAGCAKH